MHLHVKRSRRQLQELEKSQNKTPTEYTSNLLSTSHQ